MKPQHPGKLLKDLQVAEELADLLGIEFHKIEQVTQGKAPVTPAMALELGDITENSAAWWLDRQADASRELLTDARREKRLKEARNADRVQTLAKVYRLEDRTDPAAFLKWVVDELVKCHDKRRRPSARLIRAIGPIMRAAADEFDAENPKKAQNTLLVGFGLAKPSGNSFKQGPLTVSKFVADLIRREGLTLAKAEERAGREFSISTKTVRRYWNKLASDSLD